MNSNEKHVSPQCNKLRATRFCMIRVPRRAWLVGLGVAVGIILAGGGSAGAAPPKTSLCSGTEWAKVFKRVGKQNQPPPPGAQGVLFKHGAFLPCAIQK